MIGKNFGAYEIIEKIGAGGMAVVYKAWHAAMERDVAVKIMPEGMVKDKTARERFIREARTIARLEHPHILPVYDFGEVEGTAYLVMRYLASGTLGDFIRNEGAMSLSQIITLITQVADALHYAHQQGVVHRDVKPANLLMDKFGKVYLTDFGIAKVFESTHQITQTGATIGTPAYMSPEQVQAEAVDARSDIYSLGVIVYQMLVGQVPFEADTPIATALKHITELPPIPSEINPNIPFSVEQVVLKALAKDPEARFQTCEEFVRAMEAVVETKLGMPAQTTPEPPLVETIEVADALAQAPALVVEQVPAPKETKPSAPKEKRTMNPLLWIGLGIVAVTVIVFAVILGGNDPSNGISMKTDRNTQNSANQAEDVVDDFSSSPDADEGDEQDNVIVESPTSTSTSTPEETDAINFAIYSPIPGCAPSRVYLGDLAFISFGNMGNALRETADLRSSDNFVYADDDPEKIIKAESGELIHILSGPECDTGWIMWKVRTFSGHVGWTPEKDNQPESDFWFTPIESHNYCNDAPLSFLRIGDLAAVSIFPGGNSRVRSAPTGDRIGTVSPGEQLMILSGPECSGNYVWWEIISMDTGLTGWVAEGDREDYWIVLVPQY